MGLCPLEMPVHERYLQSPFRQHPGGAIALLHELGPSRVLHVFSILRLELGRYDLQSEPIPLLSSIRFPP